MVIINLTEQDIITLQMIEMDKDLNGAYEFIRDRIMKEIKKAQGMKMTSHLDGGKGSFF